MKIACVEVGVYGTNCYIVEGDGVFSSFCMVVDPGDNWDLICSNIEKPVTHVVLTHTHFDHIMALPKVLQTYPSAKLCYSSKEDVSPAFLKSVASSCLGSEAASLSVAPYDICLSDGTSLGPFTVLETPGHTKGSICLYSASDNVLISGDTLFCHGFGRTDLGGSRHDIIDSLKRLFALPPQTNVYPGHGCSTTIESERLYYHQ